MHTWPYQQTYPGLAFCEAYAAYAAQAAAAAAAAQSQQAQQAPAVVQPREDENGTRPMMYPQLEPNTYISTMFKRIDAEISSNIQHKSIENPNMIPIY